MTIGALRKFKIQIFYGTRPEFLKLIALIKKLKKEENISLQVVSTGQHKELLEPIEKEFFFQPDVNLKTLGSARNLSQLYTNIQQKTQHILEKVKPDLVIAQGDTATVFASAFTSYLQQIPFAHLEAGMRTQDKYSPFPEEINRRLTSHIADLHFCWTEIEKENLLVEGISRENIFVTGNTLIDTLKETYQAEFDFSEYLSSDILQKIDHGQKIILVTQHRRENMGERHLKIFKAIKKILKENKDYLAIYPVHYNPQVRDTAYDFFKEVKNAHLIEPLSYKPFINLMARSAVVITDSGGLQEEAPSFGVPVLVTREHTERPLVIKEEKAFLVSDNFKKIEEKFAEIKDDWDYSDTSNPYGDGSSAERVVKIIKEKYLS